MSRLIYSKAQEADVAERERTAFEKGAVWSYALNRPETWVAVNMDLIKNRALQEFPVPVEYRVVVIPDHKTKAGVPLSLRVVDDRVQFSYQTVATALNRTHWHDLIKHIKQANPSVLDDFQAIVKYSAELFKNPTVPIYPDMME